MPVVEIKIPQLGEGLQEARLIRFLKQPGEAVAQDEPIYEMETDKAVMEIESPTAGVLEAWQANEDDVLPIGAVIGRINSDGASAVKSVQSRPDEPAAVKSPASTPPSPAPSPQVVSSDLRAGAVPPRTRAYAKEKGLSDSDLAQIAATVVKVMPDDVDRHLAAQSKPAKPAKEGDIAYKDFAMPQRQRTLVYRLQQATRDVVPATMEVRLDWGPVEAVRARMKENVAGPQPSQFLLFAWCVAQASKNHPRFRSALLNDTTLREYEHLHLGIAVAREEDELLLARVSNADALEFKEFVAAAQAAIQKAREGVDQAADVMQLSLTNMAGQGVRMGIPVIAAPAAGTLFVGEPFDEAYPLPGGGIGFRRTAAMVLSFDHRISNGVGAANFLSEIRDRVGSIADSMQQ